MGLSNCPYINCKSSTSTYLDPTTKKRISFHRFPKDPGRCSIWVAACKNKKLENETPSVLYKSYKLCSNHFADWCFMNPNQSPRLVHNAIPDCPIKPKVIPREIIAQSVPTELSGPSSEWDMPLQTLKQELIEQCYETCSTSLYSDGHQTSAEDCTLLNNGEKCSLREKEFISDFKREGAELAARACSVHYKTCSSNFESSGHQTSAEDCTLLNQNREKCSPREKESMADFEREGAELLVARACSVLFDHDYDRNPIEELSRLNKQGGKCNGGEKEPMIEIKRRGNKLFIETCSTEFDSGNHHKKLSEVHSTRMKNGENYSPREKELAMELKRKEKELKILQSKYSNLQRVCLSLQLQLIRSYQ